MKHRTALQQLEEPIECQLASALIEATLDWWRKARLEVEAQVQAAVGLSMQHIISSPEGRREVVSPTHEILSTTFELRQIFEKHGRAWRRLVFDVVEENGSWRYVAHFDY